MTRAPLPPRGSEPWYPRPELLDALDRFDANELALALRRARRERVNAYLGVITAAMWIGTLVVFVVRFDRAAFGILQALWLVACVAFVVVNVRRARRDRVCAEQLRAEAYSDAEHALEAKLWRAGDPHLRALSAGEARRS